MSFMKTVTNAIDHDLAIGESSVLGHSILPARPINKESSGDGDMRWERVSETRRILQKSKSTEIPLGRLLM
jgi:hypothetical protein